MVSDSDDASLVGRHLGAYRVLAPLGACGLGEVYRAPDKSLVLLAHGVAPTRTRAHGRVNRERLAEIDLHWHDLRHEAACRWLSKGLALRAIQLLLGHADLKTTQRYLNVTDEELRRTMTEKLWSGRAAGK